MSEPITNAAVLLAAIRATGGLPVSHAEPAAVQAAGRAAAAAGRTLLRATVPSPAPGARPVTG